MGHYPRYQAPVAIIVKVENIWDTITIGVNTGGAGGGAQRIVIVHIKQSGTRPISESIAVAIGCVGVKILSAQEKARDLCAIANAVAVGIDREIPGVELGRLSRVTQPITIGVGLAVDGTGRGGDDVQLGWTGAAGERIE
ncbi:MAG: hypothetical protein R2867_27995 [Caldilineaceae bacterium]